MKIDAYAGHYTNSGITNYVIYTVNKKAVKQFQYNTVEGVIAQLLKEYTVKPPKEVGLFPLHDKKKMPTVNPMEDTDLAKIANTFKKSFNCKVTREDVASEVPMNF